MGSDLDLIVVVERSDLPFERRAVEWDTTDLPVPADLLVYTEDEWRLLPQRGGFYNTLVREVVWVFVSNEAGGV